MEKFQIEFFNSQPELLRDYDLEKPQSYSLNLNSFNYPDESLMSSSYSGHFTQYNFEQESFYDSQNNLSESDSLRPVKKNLNSKFDLEKSLDDDNKIFNFEIESMLCCLRLRKIEEELL